MSKSSWKNFDETCPFYKFSSLKIPIPVKMGGVYCKKYCKHFAGVNFIEGSINCTKERILQNLKLILKTPLN